MKELLYQEVRIFFTALMFYTRIPCPSFADHKEEYLNKATRYFPFIGFIVASLSFAAFAGAQYLFSSELSVLISIIVSVFTTGAFHEDGFADTCDGFGGGWTKEKILNIMKDSRIGTYGVVGLVLILGVKFFALLDISNKVGLPTFGLYLVCGHVLSRFFSILIIRLLPYSREDASSKVKPIAKGISATDLMVASLFTAVPLVILVFLHPLFLLVILPLLLTTLYLKWYFNKWIGGYTGDCLGATQQVNEVIFYLSILSIWKFI
ncbi:adenosylcobinamide-GDP ribazoletransferase [Rhodocytophaga rosea]|uniref:Adenosylcobinamide-GDP ribazoletransferase n=1 Tax=Rhodocytophaga rosea TaxID=2704465 RepID=A0A6C0GUQ7_9BACT|nr:adenosylcobinamide-GDP ribazoletransferase [Rhodocytophaga rosea]QHT71070.1 adenosylcobinamide-GDP ribazoletransferase [Rhodocytophaga rosea]